jgi:TRAP-type C4-dicarboxylate transport system permease large subunit
MAGKLAGVLGIFNNLFTAKIAACVGFATLSGSSRASAVTMGRLALPHMKRYKYADNLSTGSVAAGGTLDFLIPPSGGMILYAVLTEQSVGRLFMAGLSRGSF